MCGIVGVASDRAGAGGGRHGLDVMRDRMYHRGPDDAGVWWSADGAVGLAMRRLAVLDLSAAGHQPMADASGRYHLVFNGEIYNFVELRAELESTGVRFRGHADSEVLVEAYRAWGLDCLLRLDGMFAFAIYDAEARELVLARDRAGEKPLFYRHGEGRLVFASELKAVMADPSVPRTIDREALEHYLAYGYVPGELCILSGVRKLRPGHALRYRVGADREETWAYWELPEPPRAETRATPVLALVDELETLLLDSVRLRLVADVPVGILLSGGLDSALVTAMAARLSKGPVRTFTVRFPGHGAHDEGGHAAQVARHFATQHTELCAEPATVEVLPTLARQFDEPIADSSMVPTYLVSRLIRQHATVALGGDGGDELFGGYPHYTWLQQQARARRFVPRPLRAAMGVAAARWLPLGTRGRNHAIGFGAGVARSVAHVNLYFDAATRRRLVAPFSGESPETRRARRCRPLHSILQQATRADFEAYLPDDILVKVDRASMLASLEVRAPWLDHRLIALAFGRTPDDLRAGRDGRKVLPRLLAERLLPPGLDLRRKQGFSLPLDAWFRGEWGRYVEEVLTSPEQRLFDAGVVAELFAGQRRGRNNTPRLFALAFFELWRREYGATLG